MNYDNILVETEANFAIITINRPKKLNALNQKTIEELHHAFKQAENNSDIRVIILTGAEEKAFVAGADISEFADYSVKEGRKLAAKGQKLLFDFIENLSKPVIAAINGYALGGGLELAMACHFRIASDNAKMGLPEVSLGLIPGYGGTQRLPQLVGKGMAMEMIMTAGMIDANKALEISLVNHVTNLGDLMSKSKSIASKIAAQSPRAIKAAIKAINAGFDNASNGFEEEIEQFGNSFGTDDFKEGTSAFLEKRKAQFKGQ